MSRNPTPTTDATNEEKIEALFNEQRLKNEQRKDTSTFQQFGQSQASEEGGRWAKPTQVVGSTAAPEYPRQPENSFSNQAASVADEPPYDGDMSTPIVGESWEVEASLERAQASFPNPDDAARRGAAGSLDDISEVEPPLSQIPNPNRRGSPNDDD